MLRCAGVREPIVDTYRSANRHLFDHGGPGVCTAHQGTRRIGDMAALTGRGTHGRFAETQGQDLELHLKKENTALASMGPVVIDEAWYLW